jgi:hypothetical protein
MSINTFTMLSMGILSPSDVLNSGLIKNAGTSDIKVLNTIFIKTNNYINEIF